MEIQEAQEILLRQNRQFDILRNIKKIIITNNYIDEDIEYSILQLERFTKNKK